MPNLKDILKEIITFKEPDTIEKFVMEEEDNERSRSRQTGRKKSGQQEAERGEYRDKKVSTILDENKELMKQVYSVPKSGDVVLREFDIAVKDKVISAFLIFIDGMVDRAIINAFILQPLMLLSNLEIRNEAEKLEDYIKDHLLPQNQLKVSKDLREIIYQINFGGCAVFVDGLGEVFIADVKGWEHRGIERPNNELILRGPQEGFNEVLRSNTALIRKFLLDEKLVVENMTVGKRSKTPCALLYIRDIANDSLVKEVERRLKGIDADYILSSGELEQYIEDNTFLPAPQLLATERPDRTASHLTEGKVAVLVNGSPFALVMPATLTSLMHSPEDSFARFPYGSFMRLIRFMGVFLALLLPGIYVAVTNYHIEMIPTDLLMSIESARERVPFPTIIEILIMEISFDLIREAGVRIPGPIGPTLGIIGALILGQAAVAANIVSPILIIIVAVTGIGNFTVPDYSLSFSVRITRFIYIILGSMAGLLGITTGVFIHGLYFAAAKSFGVPYLSPFGPITARKLADSLIRAPVWRQERMPDFLNTKKKYKQGDTSRTWIEGNGEDKGDGEEADNR